MRRLAIFVEGYSEVLFVERFIHEVMGGKNVIIEARKIRGGTSVKRSVATIRAARQFSNEKYYVLIIDCGGDDLVKSRIMEEHDNLSRKGYCKIIGLRDVRPKYTRAEIPRLESGLKKYIKTSLIPVQFILSVMEIEAWFLAEFAHFQKVDPQITLGAIRNSLGFDPESEDMAARLEPTSDLHNCYQIGGKSYDKSVVAATVEVLDFDHLYVDLRHRVPYLNCLSESIDEFFT